MITPEEYKEGNKIIAFYDGWSLQERKFEGAPLYRKGGLIFTDDFFSYHIYWELLMPVIEKISQEVYETWADDVVGNFVKERAFPRTFGMINDKTGNPMFRFNRCSLFEAETLKKAAWRAVVDYLQNKKAL